jgi:DNA-binding NarL/FixJ family response regulator
MATYKLLLIDEEKDTFDDFKDYLDISTTKDKIEVIEVYPLEELQEMIELIFKINPDAIITDFRLNEMKTDINYNVPYDGVELVEEFLKFRQGFPCFVLTAFDDLAVSASDDVNKVYIKNILHNNKEESKAKAKFLDRVINQIEHYQTKIKEAEAELIELIKLRKSGKANITNENRIIELDSFLESVIDRKSSIPPEFKKLSNDERLNDLLSKVDAILKKVNNGQ